MLNQNQPTKPTNSSQKACDIILIWILSFSRHYEDDFEPEDEEDNGAEENKSRVGGQRVDSPAMRTRTNIKLGSSEDDIYDFSTDNLGYWRAIRVEIQGR